MAQLGYARGRINLLINKTARMMHQMHASGGYFFALQAKQPEGTNMR